VATDQARASLGAQLVVLWVVHNGVQRAKGRCFDTPSIVVDAGRKKSGGTITHQSVEGYDSTKWAGSNLAAKWGVRLEDPQDLPR
jgi:hypothetical protein